MSIQETKLPTSCLVSLTSVADHSLLPRLGKQVVLLPDQGNAVTFRVTTALANLKTTFVYPALPTRQFSLQMELFR
jgi:hypothetical protein